MTLKLIHHMTFIMKFLLFFLTMGDNNFVRDHSRVADRLIISLVFL